MPITASDATLTTTELRPRRPLPGGRATVGGLLVALSVLALHTSARADGTSTTVVVARSTISPGQRLSAGDLRAERASIPAALMRASFPRTADLVGQVSLVALRPGELVQRSQVADTPAALPDHRMSFPIEAAYAAGGELRPGEAVDIFATYGTGLDATTELVVRDALVLGVGGGRDALGGSDRLTVTVALPDRAAVGRTAHAVRVGQVLLSVAAPDATAEDPGPLRLAPESAGRADTTDGADPDLADGETVDEMTEGDADASGPGTGVDEGSLP